MFANPGTYRLEVVKPDYLFPSVYLQNKQSDLDFAELYHGAPFAMSSRSALTYPIPMDPKEKGETPKEVVRRGRVRAIQKTLAYSGPLFAIASVAITPTLTTTALMAGQFILLGVFRRFAQAAAPKTWATVRDAVTEQPLSFAVVRIFDSNYNKLLETQVTDKHGRYAFLVGRGSFYVTTDKPGYASYRSEIIDLTLPGSQEIVKRDIRLKRSANLLST